MSSSKTGQSTFSLTDFDYFIMPNGEMFFPYNFLPKGQRYHELLVINLVSYRKTHTYAHIHMQMFSVLIIHALFLTEL